MARNMADCLLLRCPALLLQVREWLQQRTDAVVMFHPELRHAGFLLDIPWQQQIIKQLLPLLDHKLLLQQQPPASGLQAQSDAASSARQRLLTQDEEHGSDRGSVAGVECDWQGPGVLQQQPTTPQTHKQQQPGPSSSRATSCSRHSSFELTAVAAVPPECAGTVGGHAAAAAAAPAGPDDAASCCDEDDCSSSSGSSMYASMYTETGSVSSSRASLQGGGTGQQQGTLGTPEAATAEHRLIAAAEPAGSEHGLGGNTDTSWGGHAAGGSTAGASSSIGSSSVDSSAYPHPHQITGQDSKGSVVAAMMLPAHLQLSPSLASGLPADDADATPHPPGPGLVAPHASLASIQSSRICNGNSYNTPGSSDLWQGGSFSSPFAAAGVSAGAFSRQHQLLQAPAIQIQPLESWTGVVAFAPASCCGQSRGGSSAASAAAELESPRTFFSGCSSHSWQDLAALAAAREAAAAAHILLQPMQVLQKLRQMSQREQKPEHHHHQQQQQQRDEWQQQQRDNRQQQIQHVMQQHQELDVRHVQDACVSSQQQAVSSKRDSMLRRVEVLLHRRQNRRVEAAARAGGGPSPRNSAAGVFAR
jgi:hypothetical protein